MVKNNLPIVALVGRPNVGKSTLFNTWIGERRAITHDRPGTTRDRLFAPIKAGGRRFWLVDTAGLTNSLGDSLEEELQKQTQVALTQAQVIIFLVDGRAPLTADDYAVADQLRRSKTAVKLVVNKIDDGNATIAWNFAQLGLGEPLALSGRHGWQLLELETQVLDLLPTTAAEEPEFSAENLRVAFVGRPNVGKSTLLNQLLKNPRSAVSDQAGTTRDTVRGNFQLPSGRAVELMDTAGMRRPGKRHQESLEYWSGLRTAQAIEQSQVCIVLLDATQGVTHQDLVIIGDVIKAGKALILAVNKFDEIRAQSRQESESSTAPAEVSTWGERIEKITVNYLGYLQAKIRFAPWSPVVFISAKLGGKTLNSLLNSIEPVHENAQKRLSTAELNRWLESATQKHAEPSHGRYLGKIKYVTQTETAPPTFVFFVNQVAAFHFSYRRFLENHLRQSYDFLGTPIRLVFRSKDPLKDSKTPRKNR